MANRKRFDKCLPVIKVTDETDAALRKAAKKYGEPISALVRLALRDFLIKEQNDGLS